MAAKNYPITIDQGSGWTFSFVYSTKDSVTGVKTPVNLTGYTATFRIATNTTDDTNLLSLSSPSNGISISALTGRITITVTDDQSWALKPGNAVYNIEVTPAGGDAKRLLKGPVTIVAGVPL